MAGAPADIKKTRLGVPSRFEPAGMADASPGCRGATKILSPRVE